MAKDKTKTETTTAEETKPAADWEVLAAAAQQRVKELEDFAAKILPDLHLSARHLHAMGIAAGVRLNDYYIEARSLLGQRGQDIDKSLRG